MEYIVGIIFGIIIVKLHDYLRKLSPIESSQDTKYQTDYEAYIVESEKDREYAIKNPNVKEYIQFHGGCSGCITPLVSGLGECTMCQYFDAEWNLPNLNSNDKT